MVSDSFSFPKRIILFAQFYFILLFIYVSEADILVC